MLLATVLKRGPEYQPQHLARLVQGVLEHNPDQRIICLTDFEIAIPGVVPIPLKHGWPSWWSKIELFRVCNEPTLYLDLDTVVIDELPAISNQFTMIPDVYKPGKFGSGIMSWTKCPNHIYDIFCRNPKGYMSTYSTRLKWGDQAFIADHLGQVPATFGKECRSYKVHCRRYVPKGTKIVYFHGRPRPWLVRLRYA